MPVSSRGATPGLPGSHTKVPRGPASEFDKLLQQPYKPSPAGPSDEFKRLLQQPFKPGGSAPLPVPVPAKDPTGGPGFGPRWKNPKRFGKRFIRIAGRRFLAPLDLLDPFEPLFMPKDWQVPNPLNGWTKCWGDCSTIVPNHSSKSASCNNPALYLCLSGQALGPINGILPPGIDDTAYLLSRGRDLTAGWRHQLHSRYQRANTATNVEPLLVPTYALGLPLWPMPNPNVARVVGANPDTAPSGGPDAAPQPVPDPAPSGSPAKPSTLSESETGPIGAIGFAPKTKPEPVRVDPRQPPGVGKKEVGKLGGPVKLIRLIFNVLDNISESCEVVDSVFDALPKDIQKAAKKKAGYVWSPSAKKYVLPSKGGGTSFGPDGEKVAGVGGAGAGSRAFVDNFGQYGLDGCDWKAQAIYDHADKVDSCAAIQNILKNHIEDKIHGVKEKYRPKGTVNGLAEGDKAFGMGLNDLLDTIVDMCPK